MAAVSPSFGARPAGKAAMAIGLGGTMVLHILLALALVLLTQNRQKNLDEKIAPKMLKFENVELVALGVEKPPEELPRIANPEEAVKLPDEVNLAQPENPVIDLKKPEPEKEDPDARKRKMLAELSALHNPNRPTNDDTPAGQTNGALGGTALKSLIGSYATELSKELGKYWTLPSTVSLEDAQKLAGSVRVYIRLAENGNIVSYKFKKESENPQFNASIERVLKRFEANGGGRSLPLPEDEEVRNAVINQGINLNNWEYTAR